MYKIMIQFIIILSPTIISIFFLFQNTAYIILSFFNFNVRAVDYYLMNILNNERIISIIAGFIISIFIIIMFRRINKDRLFNTGNKYHNYPLLSYWIAGKILGFEKVSLVRMPIYLQFKLILKDIFPKVIVDDDIEKKDRIIDIFERNMENSSDELNLVLIDTYEIDDSHMPANKINLPTILIKSGNHIDGNRTFNPEFIKEIRRQTNIYHNVYKTINIFSTTNTNHNKSIVQNCFKNASRTGFEDVIVYQSSRKTHVFDEGHKVL